MNSSQFIGNLLVWSILILIAAALVGGNRLMRRVIGRRLTRLETLLAVLIILALVSFLEFLQ